MTSQCALSCSGSDAREGEADRVRLLEAAETDVIYQHGGFVVVGTTGAFRCSRSRRMQGSGDTLDTKATVDTPQTFPNGCHVAESRSIPPPALRRSSPMRRWTMPASCSSHLVAGQLVGGLAQGIGQALMESAIYDEANGQLVTAPLWITRCRVRRHAADRGGQHNAPARTNPLGVKGSERPAPRARCRDYERDRERYPEGRGVEYRHAATRPIWAPAAGRLKAQPRSARAAAASTGASARLRQGRRRAARLRRDCVRALSRDRAPGRRA